MPLGLGQFCSINRCWPTNFKVRGEDRGSQDKRMVPEAACCATIVTSTVMMHPTSCQTSKITLLISNSPAGWCDILFPSCLPGMVGMWIKKQMIIVHCEFSSVLLHEFLFIAFKVITHMCEFHHLKQVPQKGMRLWVLFPSYILSCVS